MEAEILSFVDDDDSNVNAAVAALIKQIKTAKDSNGRLIWQLVQRGIGLPQQDIKDFEAPGMLVFDDEDEHPIDTTVFVDYEVRTHITLVCYIYTLQGADGSYADVQTLRRNITKATLRALWPTDGSRPGFDPEYPYWFDVPFTVKSSYSDPLHNKMPEYNLPAEWYGWTISFDMMAWNVQPPA